MGTTATNTHTISQQQTAGSTARFRQRKISVKQSLRIVYEKDVPNIIDDVQREAFDVDTGVEKGEQEERHLQAVLAASQTSRQDKPRDVYIPTPEANVIWSEYHKYYKPGWTETTSYLRSSATVEDTQGCPYNMDETDDEFVASVNEGVTDERLRLSDDEFEMLCYLFESSIAEHQPFLLTDPSKMLDFESLLQCTLDDVHRRADDKYHLDELRDNAQPVDYGPPFTPNPERTVEASLKLWGRKVYGHWRERKLASHGGSIFPTLKFENNIEKDENDPYVCFRHREVRQSRKTRRTDQQSSRRLRRLKYEMEQAQHLFRLLRRRETMRLTQLETDAAIFDVRNTAKSLKRKLRIAGDDEDFVTQKSQRVKEDTKSARQNAAHEAKSHTREATLAARDAAREARESPNTLPRTTGPNRVPDLEVYSIETQKEEKQQALRTMVKSKLRSRAQADRGWINYSENPFVPFLDYFDGEPPSGLGDPNATTSSDEAIYSTPGLWGDSSELELPLTSTFGKAYTQRIDVPPTLLKSGENSVTVLRDKDIAGVKVPRQGIAAFHRRIGTRGTNYIERLGLGAHPPEIDDPKTPEDERLRDRYLFDEAPQALTEHREDILADVAKLGGISHETQSLRIGAELTSKSYEAFQEAQNQRRRAAVSALAQAAQAAEASTVRQPMHQPPRPQSLPPHQPAQASTPNTSQEDLQVKAQTPTRQGWPRPHDNTEMRLSSHGPPKVETSV